MATGMVIPVLSKNHIFDPRPRFQQLFESQQASTGTSVRFRDVWALDMLNQGDSAVLNGEVCPFGVGDTTCVSLVFVRGGEHRFHLSRPHI